ncbi:MAG: triacylglycerol lipase [Oscillospiraceae bacterium]|nr:triacylglycerol lipase [Oscillospiraceae bacterium]
MKLLRLLGTLAAGVLLVLLGNILLLWEYSSVGTPWMAALTALLCLFWLILLIVPGRRDLGSLRLGILGQGLFLVRLCLVMSVLELPVCVLALHAVLRSPPGWPEALVLGGSVLTFFLVQAGVLLAGLVRVGGAARQIRWYWYVLLLLCWWMPGVNLLLLGYILHTAKREYRFERSRLELDAVRAESALCRTRYPVLLVHGIFFRDWQMFNYWGRIPAALQKNGARIYYGRQQSAQSIRASAEELHAQLHAVLEETGAEKVNIIAHSKGGLDTRYAMSVLGDAPYVASLTTINTPHGGCDWVEKALAAVSPAMQARIASHYERIYRRLGDPSPRFLEGVRDLTPQAAAALNARCPLEPGVRYACVMSRMRHIWSAPFPLWVGYWCIRHFSGRCQNDGLVPGEAASLPGVSLTVIEPAGQRGISHGDMIDLSRENIRGFDVREFYVRLVAELAREGL